MKLLSGFIHDALPRPMGQSGQIEMNRLADPFLAGTGAHVGPKGSDKPRRQDSHARLRGPSTTRV